MCLGQKNLSSGKQRQNVVEESVRWEDTTGNAYDSSGRISSEGELVVAHIVLVQKICLTKQSRIIDNWMRKLRNEGGRPEMPSTSGFLPDVGVESRSFHHGWISAETGREGWRRWEEEERFEWCNLIGRESTWRGTLITRKREGNYGVALPGPLDWGGREFVARLIGGNVRPDGERGLLWSWVGEGIMARCRGIFGSSDLFFIRRRFCYASCGISGVVNGR